MKHPMVPPNMLKIAAYEGLGYNTAVRFSGWRVAVLNYIDELEPQRIGNIQKHDETDEVFVLLAGRCLLFLLEGDGSGVRGTYAVEMEPRRIYNVKLGTWHTHTLSVDGSVLVIENADTDLHNSPILPATDAQRAHFAQLTAARWGAWPVPLPAAAPCRSTETAS